MAALAVEVGQAGLGVGHGFDGAARTHLVDELQRRLAQLGHLRIVRQTLDVILDVLQELVQRLANLLLLVLQVAHAGPLGGIVAAFLVLQAGEPFRQRFLPHDQLDEAGGVFDQWIDLFELPQRLHGFALELLAVLAQLAEQLGHFLIELRAGQLLLAGQAFRLLGRLLQLLGLAFPGAWSVPRRCRKGTAGWPTCGPPPRPAAALRQLRQVIFRFLAQLLLLLRLLAQAVGVVGQGFQAGAGPADTWPSAPPGRAAPAPCARTLPAR